MMGDDIMKEFKLRKYIITENEYDDSFEYLIVLCEFSYWIEHYEQLQAWCTEYNSEVVGMTVNIPNEQTLILFILRWE